MKSGFTGAMRSVVAPTRSLAATGHPQHEASLTTTAKGSYSEGRTIKSDALYAPGNPIDLQNPGTNAIRDSQIESPLEKRLPERSFARENQDGTKIPAAANASRRSPGRFHGCNLAQKRTTVESASTFQAERMAAWSTCV